MKPTTAMAVIRAGLAIQEALRLAEEDANGGRLAELLRKLEPTARLLVDIPLPPTAYPTEEEPGPSRSITCGRCHLARIVTPLSAPSCPRCGEDGLTHASPTEELT